MQQPTMAGRRRLVVVTGLTLALLATATIDPGPSLAAAPSPWVGAVERVPPLGEDAFDADLAVDAAGTATAVWTAARGSSFVIRAASRRVGGTWGSPEDRGTSVVDDAFPQIGVDAAGGATVVWRDKIGVHRYLWSVSRPAGGTWTGPTQVSDSTADSYFFRLGVGPDGTATVVWRAEAAPASVVVAATRTDGTWEAPLGVSPNGQLVGSPAVTVNAAGTSTVIWPGSDGLGQTLTSASRTKAGGWTATSSVSALVSNVGDATVITDAAGVTWAAYALFDGGEYSLEVAHRPLDGAWTTQVLSDPDVPYLADVRLAAGGDGTLAAVWRSAPASGPMRLQGTLLAPGRAWTAPTDLSGPVLEVSGPAVAVGPEGTATALWTERAAPATPRMVGAASALTGGWGPAVPLGGDLGGGGRLELDAHGDGIAMWTDFPGEGGFRLVSRVVDGEAPEVGFLQLPVVGYTGRALPFAVAPPTDRVSTVATAWAFGDGGTAAGSTPTHTYSAGGTYPVTVTATDEAGHAVVRTGTVLVHGKPTVTKVHLQRHRLVKHGPARLRKTRLAFTLAAPGRVVVRVAQKGKPARATLVLADLAPGRHRVVLRTRLDGVRLKPGTYRVKLVATNPAGKAKPKVMRLRVLRSISES